MSLDPRFRFDSFVVGAANRLAVAAGRAVADAPGVVYNPLFLYGDSGLGKTHLLGAIAHEVRSRHPEFAILYTPIDELVEQLHRAAAADQLDQLRRRMQQLQLLLLDDVQLLTGQHETQRELLRLLEALQATGRQVVIASDRPPSAIGDLDERLVARLAAGLIVDLSAPDHETRLAILRACARERGAVVERGVLEELAQVGAASVGELQAAFYRVLAHQALGEPVSAGRVREVLGAPPAPQRAAVAAGDDFASFLTDVASAVAEHVDPWRATVAEEVERWSTEGYRTDVLDALLAEPEAPAGWEDVVLDFADTVERLRTLGPVAVELDPALRDADILRDPSRLAELQRTVALLQAPPQAPPAPEGERAAAAPEAPAPAPAAAEAPRRAAPAAPAADPFFVDDEKVVWEWPDLGARLIEEVR